MSSQIALIGIGNILRGDDGIGIYIAEEIEKLQFKNVKTFTVHQLHLELLEELKEFNSVIFADASLKNEDFFFEEIKLSSSTSSSSSHRINAETFVQLSQKLYKQNTVFFICGVKGYCFDIGKKISPQTKKNAQKAIDKIVDYIKF